MPIKTLAALLTWPRWEDILQRVRKIPLRVCILFINPPFSFPGPSILIFVTFLKHRVIPQKVQTPISRDRQENWCQNLVKKKITLDVYNSSLPCWWHSLFQHGCNMLNHSGKKLFIYISLTESLQSVWSWTVIRVGRGKGKAGYRVQKNKEIVPCMILLGSVAMQCHKFRASRINIAS